MIHTPPPTAPSANGVSTNGHIPPARRRRSFWRRRIVLVPLAVVVLAGVAVFAFQQATPAPAPPPAATATAVRLTAHGEVLPADRATLRTLAGGRVVQLLVDLGDPVMSEEPIAWVNGPNGLETITAPLRGSVTGLPIHAGDTLAPGSVVATVGDLSRLQVETTDVDEYIISRIQPGQAASLRFDALDGQTFQGRVTLVGPQPETTPTGDREYPVVIEFGGLVAGPRAGMTVRVTFAE
jgi:multidrug efflux pump subunit AcrA (membrane-fusion protein)